MRRNNSVGVEFVASNVAFVLSVSEDRQKDLFSESNVYWTVHHCNS